MKRFLTRVLVATFVAFICNSTIQRAPAQEARTHSSAGVLRNADQSVDTERIIRAFSAKESVARQALNEYAYKREVVIQTIGQGKQISGEYHRVSTFTFDNSGNRYEKVSFFPLSTLSEVQLTSEDLEDLGGINQFALEASKIGQYNFTYAGKERIDELNLYMFDVAPKVLPDPKKSKDRFFQGRIWVDDQDLQIVKSRGKAVPEPANGRYPSFEIYREQVDGKYWFPTYAYSDEDLVFKSGEVVHIRARVRYTDFVRGRGKLTVIDDEGVVADNSGVKPTESKIVPGGLLNGRALTFPKPVYPAAAKKAGIKGTVIVRVIIDEQGNVTSAEATEGPEELRAPAVEAAKKSRFLPVTLYGQPARASGTVEYTFGHKD